MTIAKVPLELLIVGPLGPRGSKGRLPATLEVELMNQLARVGVKRSSIDVSISTGKPTCSSVTNQVVYAAVEFAYERAKKDLGAVEIIRGIYGLTRDQSENLVSFLGRMVQVKDEIIPERDQGFANILKGDANYQRTKEGAHQYSTSNGTTRVVVQVLRLSDGLFEVSSRANLACANGPHYEKKTIIDIERVRLSDYLENEITSANDASYNACKTFCSVPPPMKRCS